MCVCVCVCVRARFYDTSFITDYNFSIQKKYFLFSENHYLNSFVFRKIVFLGEWKKTINKKNLNKNINHKCTYLFQNI